MGEDQKGEEEMRKTRLALLTPLLLMAASCGNATTARGRVEHWRSDAEYIVVRMNGGWSIDFENDGGSTFEYWEDVDCDALEVLVHSTTDYTQRFVHSQYTIYYKGGQTR